MTEKVELDSIDMIVNESINSKIASSPNLSWMKLICNKMFSKHSLIAHGIVVISLCLLVYIYKPLQVVNIIFKHQKKTKKNVKVVTLNWKAYVLLCIKIICLYCILTAVGVYYFNKSEM